MPPLFWIVLAQLFGTSLWFTPNGIGQALQSEWGFSVSDLGWLTGSVQMGFIVGTFVIAFTGFADRFSPSCIFTFASAIGAVFNLLFITIDGQLWLGVVYRFLTGLALAGIYPMGMKLVVSWSPKQRGHALGWLVGMLTLGTASPHLLRSGLAASEVWPWVLVISSGLGLLGGYVIHRLGDGPYLQSISLKRVSPFTAYKLTSFRAAAIGYFGHCWELYAFWTLVPLFVLSAFSNGVFATMSPALWAFIIIGVGLPGCLLAGTLSRALGSARIAFIMLFISGFCCFIWPWVSASPMLALVVLIIWGFTVIADSGQYSALAATTCPKEAVGTALAMMNSIGFFLTVISIVLVTQLYGYFGAYVSWILLPGPVIGLFWLKPLLQNDPTYIKAE
jgi:MFS family permease